MIRFPETAVHKIVPLKFSGVDLKIKTSHGLFSSRQVDTGTMLLLKTLAQRGAVPAAGRVLDAGCGTGALALALKKFRPGLEVVARDRLALAAVFTAENARFNGMTVDAAPGLLLQETPGPWDLIVSNLPAKAGEPVLADFVRRSLGLVGTAGLVAVVIVEPLAAWFSSLLVQEGATVDYEEAGPGYRVFHYRSPVPGSPMKDPSFPEAYRRGEVSWAVSGRTFTHTTVYGLPNFDALDYRLQVTLPLLEHVSLRGDGLIWEPVQGHLAVWADAWAPAGSLFHFAGNDQLALAAASSLMGHRASKSHAVPFLEDLDWGPGSLGWALVQFHPEPEVPWVEGARSALARLLAPGATLVVNGSSTDLTRFLDRHRGFRILRDERFRGWRAAVLERQTTAG